MTKKCKVILRNEIVSVVDYDGTEVQLPAIHKGVDEVFVKRKGYAYWIVDNDDNGNTETTD